MRSLLLLLFFFLLLTSCKNAPPSGEQPAEDMVKLSDDLKDVLTVGEAVDFGNGVIYNRLNDSVAVRTKAPAPAVYGKCKNCFNTDNSDHSKDKSKTKDNSDTTIKDKSDHSELKGARYDNRIQSAEEYSNWFLTLVKRIVTVLMIILTIYLLFKFLS